MSFLFLIFDASPKEISVGGIYFPPLFFAIALAFFLTYLITEWMNKSGYYKYVWHPPLFFIALVAVLTTLIGILFIQV